MVEASPWSRAFEAARLQGGFIDLTDSNFHQNGLLPEAQLFREEFDIWLGSRHYEPESKGSLPAREAIASFYQAAQCPVSAPDIFLTAGTSEAYLTLFATFASAGDVVALPRPGYPLFEHLAERAHLKTVFYDQPFSWPQNPPASLKLVVVISPNNPTGRVYSSEELVRVGEFCRAHEAVLVFDEVFDAFLTEGELARPAQACPEARVVTLNGISKRFGSPDLKLAWMALSGPEAWKTEASQQLEFSNDLLLSANTYSQALLPRLFRELGPWQQEVRTLLETNRRALAAWLDSRPEVVAPPSQGGIHGLLRFTSLPRGWDDERWSLHLLEKYSLALHPGFFYEVQESGVLVYSLLKQPPAFEEGLLRLSSALSGLGALR